MLNPPAAVPVPGTYVWLKQNRHHHAIWYLSEVWRGGGGERQICAQVWG